MQNGTGFYNGSGFLFPEVDYDTKKAYDAYDVFVNGDYVGKKVLLTQNDSIKDVTDHLIKKGFNQFEDRLQGDHYEITSENGEGIKSELEVYLNIR